MLKLFIITLREFLEISLILGVLFAVTENIKYRFRYISLGVALGTAGALVIAAFTSYIAEFFQGYGQEIINACILLVASFMIIWTIIWVNAHNKELSRKIKDFKSQLDLGSFPLISLTIITASSIFREGSEIVLFTYGVVTTSNESALSLLAGGVMGAALAIAIGTLMYFGIINISGKYILKVSTFILSLMAAGMAAQGVAFLVASEVIKASSTPVWNTGWLIPQDSVVGGTLNALIGYIEQPSEIELLVYAGVLMIVWFFPSKKKQVR